MGAAVTGVAVVTGMPVLSSVVPSGSGICCTGTAIAGVVVLSAGSIVGTAAKVSAE